MELDDVDDSSGYSGNDKSGWCRTRNTLQMSWRKRFFVLSEGTLSFYKNALPRPHGLRGQMVVTDATISVDRAKERPEYFVLSIEAKDGLKPSMMPWLEDLSLNPQRKSNTENTDQSNQNHLSKKISRNI